MEFKILNFQKIEKRLTNETMGEKLQVPDYFQWYIAGISDLTNDQEFVLTDRYDNERTEVLAYNFYENESVADVLVLANNDNFLWDAPADYDLLWDIADNKYQYFRHEHKVNMSVDEEEYWKQKMKDQTVAAHTSQSVIAIPIRSNLQKVIRKMNDFLEEREVK